MQLITVQGHLGKDAEQKETPQNEVYWSGSVAVNRVKQNGEKVTTWYTYSTKNDKLVPYLKKGKEVLIVGDLAVDSYTNSNSEKITTLIINPIRIQLLGGSNSDGATQQPPQQTFNPQATPMPAPLAQSGGVKPNGEADDLPF